MKKHFYKFLVIGLLFFGMQTYGQHLISNGSQGTSIENVDNAKQGNTETNVVAPFKAQSVIVEEIIGQTMYDTQTNRALANRVFRFNDGTIGATWMMGLEEKKAFDDRGTGYNYFDGEEWDEYPEERLESEKTGWPSYAPNGANGEAVVSHTTSDGILVLTRENKGTDAWTEQLEAGPDGFEKLSYPRITASGENYSYLHMICLIRGMSATEDDLLGYYRSSDGGETWDIEHEVLDGTDDDEYIEIGADSYVFADAREDGIVAFAVFNEDHDLFVMKSEDNGDSWNKTMVWEHPYPMFDHDVLFTDTLWSPDKSGAIAIDGNGKVHLAFGLMFWIETTEGTTGYTLFKERSNGIAYWNEDMPAFENENQHDALDPEDVLVEDYNLIGWAQDLDGNGELDFLDDILTYNSKGICSMPTLSIDDNNEIFLAYSGLAEGYDDGVNNYRHIFTRHSPNGGANWGEIKDLTTSVDMLVNEFTYPMFASSSDENVYLFCNGDLYAGDDHDFFPNFQYSYFVPKDEFVGVDESVLNQVENLTVSSCYPNPVSDIGHLNLAADRGRQISFEIVDLLGKQVYFENMNISYGSNVIEFDSKRMNNGVYFYNISDGETNLSGKFIVKK